MVSFKAKAGGIGKMNIKKVEVLLWIMRICNRMGLSRNVSELATRLMLSNPELLKKYRAKTIAGGLIHVASKFCREARTQKEISEMAGISEASIRKVCKDVRIFNF